MLRRWEKKPTLAPLIVQATHALSADDELAKLAIRAVDSGLCSAEELGRYLYGAWTRPLSADVVAEVLSRLDKKVQESLDDNDQARAVRTLEQALGIADQWSETNGLASGDTPLQREVSTTTVPRTRRFLTRLVDACAPCCAHHQTLEP